MSEYITRVGLTGVIAIVSPRHPGSTPVQRVRLAGTPVYVLDTSDPNHWCWVPEPGSIATGSEVATGSNHHVATRIGSAPSDPTIEQFNPANGQFRLYITAE